MHHFNPRDNKYGAYQKKVWRRCKCVWRRWQVLLRMMWCDN